MPLEVSHGHNELIFLLFDLWLLKFDDFHEELVLKAIWGDSEVDHRHFDADFWQIVGVRHLGGHEEFEFCTVRHHLIAQFDVRATSEFDDVLLEDWLKGWIKRFCNVLEQDWVAKSDGGVANVQEFGVGEFNHLEVIFFLHVLNPLVTLTLRVDD